MEQDFGRMANFPAFIAAKSFDLMKPSYISNEMTYFAAHFDVLKKSYDNFENALLC